MEEQETNVITGRKRPLGVDPHTDSDDERLSGSSSPAAKVPAVNSVLDEIELHFQRSLAKVKPNQDGVITKPSSHSNDHQNRDRHSPSPNQQSRLTPPTSSSSSTSSPRRHVISSSKPLPPPLKLATPTSTVPSTVQSLQTHQHHHSTRGTHRQAIIVPTLNTTTGLTGLSRLSSSSSPPSSVVGPPALTVSNGLPGAGAGTSPPSSLTKPYFPANVTQIQTLPTISAATLTNLAAAGGGGSAGGVYQTVIPVASTNILTSQQQRVIHQSIPNGSSSPKRSVAVQSGASGNATTAVHLPGNATGLAAVQLTPGGPILALPSGGLAQTSSGSSSVIGQRALMTGIAGLGSGGGGGYQLQAPSVTQPGSVQIINIPDESISSAGLRRSSPAPLLADAPTLPKPPTVLNVSQIPNLIAINPSSPGSPSPSNKTPTVKVLGVSGAQSPIRVSASSTQTTPVATPTVLTPQQLAANPSLMSVIDPTIASQLLASGNTGASPVYLIPASGMPMVQQPFFIINPTGTATDVSSLQQLQQANILAGANPSLAGTSIVANPSGGYLLVSPGHGAAANFSMPLVNIASTTTVNSSQPAVPNLIPTSPAVTMTTLKPANMTTVLNSTSITGSIKPPVASRPPLKNQTSSDGAPSPAHSDVMMTPASVDDHFAQALGPQWNKLKSHNNMQPQQC